MKHDTILITLTVLTCATAEKANADPTLSSWYTEGSGNYARIWRTIEEETAEKTATDGTVTSVTTWDRSELGGGVGDQTEPVYGGIQGIAYTDSDVYISSTGLGTHTMGPWYDDYSVQDSLFPSFPGNAAILYRFPRVTNYGPDHVSSNEATNPGSCGLFVNGVPLYNTTDTFSYDAASGTDAGPQSDVSGMGDGVWNRDAFVNEGPTFDSGNSHQAMEAHHYHANPPALRHLLGDSVDYDPTVVFTGLVSRGGTSPYTENFNGEHSPIIGWVNDGLPMYGPYAYSDPMDPSTEVRRMVSGYQERDGSNGSYDIPSNGRNRLPQWSVTIAGASSTAVAANLVGPDVDDEFVLGKYMEDYAFKAHLVADSAATAFDAYTDPLSQGTFDESRHYDLNEYNVRYCVTPEFPEGTWAYFTAIAANGDPIYPYNLGPAYFGDPSMAGSVTEVPDDVVNQFEGAPGMGVIAQSIATEADPATVTIVWSGVEGGIYRVDTSVDLETWDTSSAEFTADRGTFSSAASSDGVGMEFFRILQTGLAPYDTTEFGSSAGGTGGPGGPGGPPGGGPPRP